MEENKELGKRVANESINTAIVRQSFVPVEEDKFKDKNYMVSVRAALDSYCTVDKNNHRIISQKDLKSMMRKMFNLQVKRRAAQVQDSGRVLLRLGQREFHSLD